MFDNVLFPLIIAAVVVLFIVVARLYRNKKANYDERQLLARNAAYKGSFFFLLIYCFACGMLRLFDVKWADTAVQMFLGIFLSFVLFIAICMIKDAYFSDSPTVYRYMYDKGRLFFRFAQTKFLFRHILFLVRNTVFY